MLEQSGLFLLLLLPATVWVSICVQPASSATSDLEAAVFCIFVSFCLKLHRHIQTFKAEAALPACVQVSRFLPAACHLQAVLTVSTAKSGGVLHLRSVYHEVSTI